MSDSVNIKVTPIASNHTSRQDISQNSMVTPMAHHDSHIKQEEERIKELFDKNAKDTGIMTKDQVTEVLQEMHKT
jgi:hypothetical protein